MSSGARERIAIVENGKKKLSQVEWIARLAGRMFAALQGHHARKVAGVVGEVYSVEQGNDLGRLLPAEQVLSSSPCWRSWRSSGSPPAARRSMRYARRRSGRRGRWCWPSTRRGACTARGTSGRRPPPSRSPAPPRPRAQPYRPVAGRRGLRSSYSAGPCARIASSSFLTSSRRSRSLLMTSSSALLRPSSDTSSSPFW